VNDTFASSGIAALTVIYLFWLVDENMWIGRSKSKSFFRFCINFHVYLERFSMEVLNIILGSFCENMDWFLSKRILSQCYSSISCEVVCFKISEHFFYF